MKKYKEKNEVQEEEEERENKMHENVDDKP